MNAPDTLTQMEIEGPKERSLQVKIPIDLDTRINVAVARRPGCTKRQVVIEALEAAFRE